MKTTKEVHDLRRDVFDAVDKLKKQHGGDYVLIAVTESGYSVRRTVHNKDRMIELLREAADKMEEKQ